MLGVVSIQNSAVSACAGSTSAAAAPQSCSLSRLVPSDRTALSRACWEGSSCSTPVLMYPCSCKKRQVLLSRPLSSSSPNISAETSVASGCTGGPAREEGASKGAAPRAAGPGSTVHATDGQEPAVSIGSRKLRSGNRVASTGAEAELALSCRQHHQTATRCLPRASDREKY